MLAEAAKDGTRRVGMSFIAFEAFNRVEVCNVALDCKIGLPLMFLIFFKRGLKIDKQSSMNNKTTFQLGW